MNIFKKLALWLYRDAADREVVDRRIADLREEVRRQKEYAASCRKLTGTLKKEFDRTVIDYDKKLRSVRAKLGAARRKRQ